MPTDLGFNGINVNDLSTVAYFHSQADYEKAKEKGEVDEGEVCFIGANSSSDSNSLFVTGIDGTINYYDYQYEFNEGGIQVDNLDNIQGIYKAVYMSLLKAHPDKKDEWEALLKINSNDYRLTVLQIEVAKGE